MLPGKNKKKEKELYWAIVLEPEWVQAGIWWIKGEEANFIAKSSPNAWELEEELLETADSALSAAVQNLSDEFDEEPSKAVFGLLASWVKDGEIKEIHLETIKEICKKLSLEPVGFVVLPEAIAYYYKNQEGSPLNAVVIGAFKEYIEISVFKLGNLVGSTEVARSVSYVDDVVEGLSRFSLDRAPSRFILYDGRGGDLEDVRQNLIQANWDDNKNINFLHTPKIEVMDPDEKLRAVSLAGASEIANVETIKDKTAATVQEFESDEIDTPVGSDAGNLIEPEDDVTPEELGFVVGQDAAKMMHKDKLPLSPNDTEDAQVEEPELEVPVESVRREEIRSKENAKNEIEGNEERPRNSRFSKLKFGGLGFLRKSYLGSISLPKKLPSTPIIYGVVFLVLLMIAGFLAWWYLPKATVTLYLTTRTLDERILVSVDPQFAQTGDARIAGSKVTVTASGTDSKSTTGTKVVGERASGEVTIYRIGPQIDLPSGTVLTGSGGLEFTLNESVTLASGSAISAGQISASITASDIGAQYNLASESVFRVANYSISDVEAKNESDLSGGSSTEVSAVSANDREALLNKLQNELVAKAKEQILSEIGQNQIFIEESIEIEILSTSFSAAVGDEVSNLTLELEISAEVLVVDRDEVVNLALDQLERKVPDGYVLRESQLDTDFEIESFEDGEYKILIKATANLLPDIDYDEIKKGIKGRYPAMVENYLNNEVPGFARAEITLFPKLPGRLGTLPHVVSRIEIELASER